jgi:hypothetical protein
MPRLTLTLHSNTHGAMSLDKTQEQQGGTLLSECIVTMYLATLEHTVHSDKQKLQRFTDTMYMSVARNNRNNDRSKHMCEKLHLFVHFI